MLSKQSLPPALLFLATNVHLKRCIFRRVDLRVRDPVVLDSGVVEKKRDESIITERVWPHSFLPKIRNSSLTTNVDVGA